MGVVTCGCRALRSLVQGIGQPQSEFACYGLQSSLRVNPVLILKTSVPRSFKAVLNLAAVLSVWSTSGLAANISLSPLDGDPAHAIVIVEGRLESGDEIQFRTQVGRLTKAIVDFNSNGGTFGPELPSARPSG